MNDLNFTFYLSSLSNTGAAAKHAFKTVIVSEHWFSTVNAWNGSPSEGVAAGLLICT